MTETKARLKSTLTLFPALHKFVVSLNWEKMLNNLFINPSSFLDDLCKEFI